MTSVSFEINDNSTIVTDNLKFKPIERLSHSSWLIRTIIWLRADDEKIPLFKVAKNVLTLFLAILFSITLLGIPLVCLGYKIWKEIRNDDQECKNLPHTESAFYESSNLGPQETSEFSLNERLMKEDLIFLPISYYFNNSNRNYRRKYRSKWLFEGSQDGCKGDAPVEQAEIVRNKLNNKHIAGIRFNKEKLTGKITDGTCTSMSLKFISSYFKIKEKCKRDPNYTSSMLLKNLSNLSCKLASSSEKMRVRQAAYNTIEIIKSENLIDYSKNKIEALITDRALKINYSSEEIEVNNAEKWNISQQVANLAEGVFLLRIIKPNNNEKLEERGHSLVYIKEEGIGLFYDANYGVLNLHSTEHSNVLSEWMVMNWRDFQISKARFYKVNLGSVVNY
jgi:hypothetical protein